MFYACSALRRAGAHAGSANLATAPARGNVLSLSIVLLSNHFCNMLLQGTLVKFVRALDEQQRLALRQQQVTLLPFRLS